VVEPGPEGGGRGGVGGLQLRGAGDLVVQGWVAELAGVGGGLPVAGGEVGAGELAEEVVGGGVVGAPAAVDDLGVVAGVVGVGEVGAVGQQAQRGAVAELAQRGDGVAGFGDVGLWGGVFQTVIFIPVVPEAATSRRARARSGACQRPSAVGLRV
jgi:hypothetical protein